MWINCAVYRDRFSFDVSGPGDLESMARVEIMMMASHLIHRIVGQDSLVALLMESLMASGRVNMFIDTHVSPVFGPNTKRLNFWFPEMNIFPIDKEFSDGKQIVESRGKNGTLNGLTFTTDIKLTVTVTHVGDEQIEGILASEPTWFCGQIIKFEDQSAAPHAPGNDEKKTQK